MTRIGDVTFLMWLSDTHDMRGPNEDIYNSLRGRFVRDGDFLRSFCQTCLLPGQKLRWTKGLPGCAQLPQDPRKVLESRTKSTVGMYQPLMIGDTVR
jgi:hypothetical protein